MSVPLYFDHHIPRQVADGLRRREVDVLTAYEDGHARRPDDELLKRSTSLGRLLVTQDDDLLAIASEWQLMMRPFAGVAYAHQRGISIGEAIRDLELMSKILNEEDTRNQVFYLPL